MLLGLPGGLPARLQRFIVSADKQRVHKSREHIAFISGRFSAFFLSAALICLGPPEIRGAYADEGISLPAG